jgi:hypothetical protein
MASTTNSTSPAYSQQQIDYLNSQLVPVNPVDSRVQLASRDALRNHANERPTMFRNTFKHPKIFENIYKIYERCKGHINNTAKVSVQNYPDIFKQLHTHRLDCSSRTTISILDQLKCHFDYLNENGIEIGIKVDRNGIEIKRDVPGISEVNIGKMKNVITRIYYAPMSYFAKLLNIDVKFTNEPTLEQARAVFDNDKIIERQIENYLLNKKNFEHFKDRLIKTCRNKIKNNENPRLFQKMKEQVKLFTYENLVEILKQKYPNQIEY